LVGVVLITGAPDDRLVDVAAEMVPAVPSDTDQTGASSASATTMTISVGGEIDDGQPAG
jgi:hypothetical protein